MMLTVYLNRYTAVFRCRICAYMAQIFLSLRASGVFFLSVVLEELPFDFID